VSDTLEVDPIPPATAAQIAATKPSPGDGLLYAMGALVICGYFGLIVLYMTGPVEEARLAPARDVLQYLTPLIGVVIGYFFGGAASGRRKDETIAAVVTAAKGNQP